MKTSTRKQLEAAGWNVGSAENFVELRDDEVTLLEMGEYFGRRVKKLRAYDGLIQTALEKTMSSSQSRVAKTESGHPGVSLELMVRALLALVADPGEVGTCISAITA
jgi:hypothetical protein